MIIFKKERIELTRKLRLIDALDSQDWELEVADSNRVEEFINVATIDISLTSDAKRALISLCVSSYNDFLDNNASSQIIEMKLEQLLMNDTDLRKELCEYWAADKELEDENYNVSSFLRRIKMS